MLLLFKLPKAPLAALGSALPLLPVFPTSGNNYSGLERKLPVPQTDHRQHMGTRWQQILQETKRAPRVAKPAKGQRPKVLRYQTPPSWAALATKLRGTGAGARCPGHGHQDQPKAEEQGHWKSSGPPMTQARN